MPAAIRPANIAPIKAVGNPLPGRSQPATPPYTANSGIITGRAGNSGGIPVNKELQTGVRMPTSAPVIGPHSNPANKTGICIGKKMEPAAPAA